MTAKSNTQAKGAQFRVWLEQFVAWQHGPDESLHKTIETLFTAASDDAKASFYAELVETLTFLGDNWTDENIGKLIEKHIG